MNSQAKNTFFSANSIKNIPRSTSYSAQLPSQKSVQHELNPKAFVHREVFNSKMYQTSANVGSICNNGKKFFNIAIPKKQRIANGMGDQEDQYLKQIKQKIKQNPLKKEYSEILQVLLHHFNLLEKNTKYLEDNHPVKFTLMNINKYLQDLMLMFHDDLTALIKKAREMELNINEKKRLSQIKLNEQKMQESRLKIQNNASLLIHNHNSKVSDMKKKLSLLQFQNKKMKLLCERLEEKLLSKDRQLKQKTQQCMEHEKNLIEMQKEQENFDFKMKKLKEELEVAHIVKEQNLADKMGFIFRNN